MRRRTLAKAVLFASAATLAGVAALTMSLDPPRPFPGKLCAAPRRTLGAGSFGTVHFANSCSAAVQPALQNEIANGFRV